MRRILLALILIAFSLSCGDSHILNRLKEIQREIYFTEVDGLQALPRDGGILFTWEAKDYPLDYRIVFEFRQELEPLFTIDADPSTGSYLYETQPYIGYYLDVYLTDAKGNQTLSQFLGETSAARSGDLILSHAGNGAVNGVFKRNSVINQVQIGDALYYIHYFAAGRVWTTYEYIAYVVDFENGKDNWIIYYDDSVMTFHYKNMTNLDQQEVLGACPLIGWELDVDGAAPRPIFSIVP